MKRKIKNAVLNTLTGIAAVVCFFSIFCIDTESPIPMICLIVSLLWLAYFGWCNGLFEIGGANNADFQN